MQRTFFVAGLLAIACVELIVVASAQPMGATAGELRLACDAENDLYRLLVRGGNKPLRFDTAEQAIEAAPIEATVLILADKYPTETTAVTEDSFARARTKRLRMYVEYPRVIPGIELGKPRGVQWERVAVASETVDLGLAKLRLLGINDAQYLPVAGPAPLLSLARVAGFDTAVFGLPSEQHPILFQGAHGELIATTKLSHFVTGRYAPAADWVVMWSHLLDGLNPEGAPHRLIAEPIVRPCYSEHQTLPADAEPRSLERLASWYQNSRLLLTEGRAREIHKLLAEGKEVTPTPSQDERGDGSQGILEGYASRILPSGDQLQRTPLRADCQAETAAVLALHAQLEQDAGSREVATNLLNYLYFDSELCQRERGNPRHPSFGLIGWGAISPGWRIANYGDDNARALLATLAAAACLESDHWDAPVLRALYANLRTTGKLGFRGDRIDLPQLEEQGWRALAERETINYSPSFEAYSWACFLWAYARTGDPVFLERAKSGIQMTMAAYPGEWRWGDHLDRSRMLLPLAWLVRVEDTPLHRDWLMAVADDLLKNQQPCGAIPEQLSRASTGHFLAPASNEAYGASETPLLQVDGDPVSDQLYTTCFALLGLHEAVAATGDKSLREAEDRMVDYIVRIQVESLAVPYLDGTWFRAFDFKRWDYWSSSGDMGWGAWCAETGWGPAWNGIVLGLRLKQSSLWDLTAGSTISRQQDAVRKEMAENDGGPWTGADADGN